VSERTAFYTAGKRLREVPLSGFCARWIRTEQINMPEIIPENAQKFLRSSTKRDLK
jgi:hypothetical protein